MSEPKKARAAYAKEHNVSTSDAIQTMVLVNLDTTTEPVTPAGPAHLLVRFGQAERELIRLAAQVLNIAQADFTRTVLVRTALKIITENAKR